MNVVLIKRRNLMKMILFIYKLREFNANFNSVQIQMRIDKNMN